MTTITLFFLRFFLPMLLWLQGYPFKTINRKQMFNMVLKELGERIYKLRDSLGMNRQILADEMKIYLGDILLVEAGYHQDVDLYKRISEYLTTKIEEKIDARY